jgi:fatty-acyl-CoA synthase/long-chain acyl-CoA synthetase
MPSRYPMTLPALFERVFAKYADRVALVDRERSVTFGELADRSARFATALGNAEIGIEDRVGVLLPNGIRFAAVDLGILRAGATRLPLNPQHTGDELAYLLDDADAELLVCADDTVDAVVDALKALPEPDVSVVVDGDLPGSRPSGVEWYGYDEFLAPDGTPSSFPRPEPERVAGHFYTGGTTGRPKGVHYTHRCLVENFQAVVTEFGFSGTDVGLLAPPLSHSAGTFCYGALLAGGEVHLRNGFDPAALVDAVARREVTWTFLVPTMIYRLLDAEPAPVDLASLERIIYGAAPIRTARLEEAIELFGPIFHQFYGQTEVPNLITSFPPQEHQHALAADDVDRLASAGTPCLRTTVSVRDRETDEELPAGEVGEIVVTAPYTFDGYHDDPEATSETLRDGWVYTGDIGVVDEDGYLTLLDRESDVIVTGGMNVYSKAVERVVLDHPAVADAVVVGVPHEEWGEAVHAVVVADDSVDTAEIREFVGERLASYKKPKSVSVVDALPETALGKIDRAAVRERYWTDEDRSIG